MAKLSSPLITKQMPWHANMTEKNHLGKALIIKPDVFEGYMNQLFTSKFYSDNPLTAALTGEGRKKSINGTEWEWGLRGATGRPLVVLENIIATNPKPGEGKTSFDIKLDEDWYKAGDIIHPGDKSFSCRIQEAKGRSGQGFIYTVRLMSDDLGAFLPTKYLIPGTPWAKMFSQYGEASEQSGSTQYALPLTLKNRMSRYRKMYQVTGDAANEVLAVKIPDSKGGMHDSWIKYAEVEYWAQWYKELERGAWYSRYTNTVLDANGRPIYSGPGVQQQLEDSHVHNYSFLSAKLIEEYLMDIFYGRIKPGKARSIKAYTGEYGMFLFHNAMQDWANASGFIKIVDQFMVDKTKSEYHQNAYSAGYQFVKYRMANGGELELVHNPLYDDKEINFEIDPVTGYPTESMRFTFLDFSEDGLNSNIQWIDKNNGLKLGYVAGLHNPFGPNTTQSNMSHAGDYYEMHVQKQFGIHIEDISRCGELILKRS